MTNLSVLDFPLADSQRSWCRPADKSSAAIGVGPLTTPSTETVHQPLLEAMLRRPLPLATGPAGGAGVAGRAGDADAEATTGRESTLITGKSWASGDGTASALGGGVLVGTTATGTERPTPRARKRITPKATAPTTLAPSAIATKAHIP